MSRTAQGLPKPDQRGTDTADLLALTRNPARLRDEVTTPVKPAPGRAGRSEIVVATLVIVGVL